MQFFHVVAALSMASSALAAVDCWGYCQCLKEDGSHCCVDAFNGADMGNGTPTKSGENCENRCGGLSHWVNNEAVPCGSSKWSCVSAWSGQFRDACVRDHGPRAG